MKISTEIDSAANKVGFEKAVELVAKAGFDCWDFSMFQMCVFDWGKWELIKRGHPLEARDTALALAEKLRKIGEKNGISCNQGHAPFPVSCEPILEYMPLSIECLAEAGGKILIIHPDNNKSAEENAVMYNELLPLAKRLGVTIATENMWNWYHDRDCAAPAACSSPEDFCRHIDVVNDKNFGACVDIGHAEMMGVKNGAAKMLEALGNRVIALHVHDNDLKHDNHQLPGAMLIDFDTVTAALRKIDYKGEFTLECGTHLSGKTADNVFEGLKEMRQVAFDLAAKI